MITQCCDEPSASQKKRPAHSLGNGSKVRPASTETPRMESELTARGRMEPGMPSRLTVNKEGDTVNTTGPLLPEANLCFQKCVSK